MKALALIASFFLLAGSAAAAPSPKELQAEFVKTMVKQHGFEAAELNALLNEAKVRKPILDAISRPAEKRLTWGKYRKIFVTPKRTKGGVKFWNENAETLQQASEKYGIPPEIMVAIIGVETYYGRHTGKFPVLDALVTLGFHYPKRAKFFRSELSHFLRLAREENVDPRKPMGSYAGAMGRPQFISSSYRAYAVDFDGDGKRDIWKNNKDVIGSVANYFARHGWKKGHPITQRVSGVNKTHKAIIKAGYKPKYTVGDLTAKGVKLRDKLAADAATSLLELKTAKGAQHWLGLHNFYVITRYNHSPLYAMAVYQLAEAIRTLKHKQS